MTSPGRLDLKLGFSCNNNCRFCAQGHNRGQGDKSTAKVKKELERFKGKADDVVFTGGEPTIRPDIIDLVRHARKLGYRGIQVQSNGRRFFYREFCRQMIDAGANEFAPALHGHIPDLHDFLTSCRGSFNQTVTGIHNLKNLGQLVLTNTVVTKPNCFHVPDIARLLSRLGVDQFQFAFVHPVGNAWTNYDSIVPRISVAAEKIREGLRIGTEAGIRVMAEAVPFCLMKGFEDRVAEICIPDTRVAEMSLVINDYERARRDFAKVKFPSCEACMHFQECEGPWKEYPEKRGSREFVPVED